MCAKPRGQDTVRGKVRVSIVMGKRTAEETGLPKSNGRIIVDRSNVERQFQVNTHR